MEMCRLELIDTNVYYSHEPFKLVSLRSEAGGGARRQAVAVNNTVSLRNGGGGGNNARVWPLLSQNMCHVRSTADSVLAVHHHPFLSDTSSLANLCEAEKIACVQRNILDE